MDTAFGVQSPASVVTVGTLLLHCWYTQPTCNVFRFCEVGAMNVFGGTGASLPYSDTFLMCFTCDSSSSSFPASTVAAQSIGPC